jgi:TPR repeat protein
MKTLTNILTASFALLALGCDKGSPTTKSGGGANPAETISLTTANIATLTKLAQSGNTEAQFLLGKRYYSGDGVEKDFNEAVAWYRKAAQQGHAKAQDNLGECYYNGEGVKKDLSEAVGWYRKAAEQGHAEAQYNLGSCYFEGDGVEADVKQAVSWHRKAAQQGHAEAQISIGACYLAGRGVEQDAVEGLAWCYVARNNGVSQKFEQANQVIQLLERKVGSSITSSAKKRAQEIEDSLKK